MPLAPTPDVWRTYLGDQVAPLRARAREIERYRWLGSQLGRRWKRWRCGAGHDGAQDRILAGGQARRLRNNPHHTDSHRRRTSDAAALSDIPRMEQYATMAVSGSRWGLVANATRMVCIGPIPDDVRAWHDAQLKSMQQRSQPHTRAGPCQMYTTKSSRFTPALSDEWQSTIWRRHGISSPRLSGDRSEQRDNNQAFAWNPSAWHENRGCYNRCEMDLTSLLRPELPCSIRQRWHRYVRPDILGDSSRTNCPTP